MIFCGVGDMTRPKGQAPVGFKAWTAPTTKVRFCAFPWAHDFSQTSSDCKFCVIKKRNFKFSRNAQLHVYGGHIEKNIWLYIIVLVGKRSVLPFSAYYKVYDKFRICSGYIFQIYLIKILAVKLRFPRLIPTFPHRNPVVFTLACRDCEKSHSSFGSLLNFS